MILDITKQLDFINDSLRKTFVTDKETEKISDEHSNACNGCELCSADDYQIYKDEEINQLNANR